MAINNNHIRLKRQNRIKSNWKSPFTFALMFGLGFISLILIILILWGFFSSIKTIDDFIDNPVWLPTGMPWNWAWSNYVDVMAQFHVPITTLSGSREVWFEEMILNSVLFAVIGSLIQTFSVCWVAYLTQRFKNKVSSIIYLVVIFVMIIPSFNSQASLLKISRALGVYDTMFSYYFMKISFTNYFYLVFFAAFRVLPKDYDESALVDGAGDLVIFFKIIFPLVSGVFLTIFLLSFMGSWNDYMTPIVFMPSKYTIAYGVFYLVNGNVQGLSRVPLKLAICYLFSLPILILFIFFRDRIMNSVNIGGIKE